MKLSKNLNRIFILVIINSVLIYYGKLLLERGGDFSNGFLVGWIHGIVFCISGTILFLFLKMVNLNWGVRWKEKK